MQYYENDQIYIRFRKIIQAYPTIVSFVQKVPYNIGSQTIGSTQLSFYLFYFLASTFRRWDLSLSSQLLLLNEIESDENNTPI